MQKISFALTKYDLIQGWAGEPICFSASHSTLKGLQDPVREADPPLA